MIFEKKDLTSEFLFYYLMNLLLALNSPHTPTEYLTLMFGAVTDNISSRRFDEVFPGIVLVTRADM